jgi:hypothetical protein
MLGNINAAGAALRNWVIDLHNELAGSGIEGPHRDQHLDRRRRPRGHPFSHS